MNSDNKAEKTWTQGQVRETFVRGREQHADFRGVNISRAEFESWLAAHDEELERQIQGWVKSATEAKDAHREEVEALRTRLAEAEAVIAKVRGLARVRTWAESLSRDATGAPFPQMVNMDDLRRILECSPTAVLAEREREAAARALEAAADTWLSEYVPYTEQTGLGPVPYLFARAASIRSGSEGDNR
jgi:hypothetical protein